jgi:protein-L-isoaspartate(D-aspartate) O-methyltransferase
VLARLAAEVITIERVEELAGGARDLLDAIGVANVEVLVGDGSEGLPERAPFDSIAVHATGPSAPLRLLEELVVGGGLVIPIASDTADLLTVFHRTGERVDPATGEGLEREVIGPCRFVPLIGSEGFPE